jgi:hypothetical protein
MCRIHKPRVKYNNGVEIFFPFVSGLITLIFFSSPHHYGSAVRLCMCVNVFFRIFSETKNGDEIVSFQSSVGFCAHSVGEWQSKLKIQSNWIQSDIAVKVRESLKDFLRLIWNFAIFWLFLHLMRKYICALTQATEVHHQINAFCDISMILFVSFA